VLAASNFTFSGRTVRGAAQNGIYVVSTHVRIVGSTIERNNLHGIALWSADGRIENNVIRSNAVAGLHLERNASAGASGNTIASNGSNGVELRRNSEANLSGNTITGNGFSPPAGPGSNAGVHVRYSVVGFDGTNVIADNAGVGDGVFAGLVEIVQATITGNGGGGVGGTTGATVLLDGGTISGNTGPGVSLGPRVTSRINGTEVVGNTGANGIELRQALVLTLGGPDCIRQRRLRAAMPGRRVELHRLDVRHDRSGLHGFLTAGHAYRRGRRRGRPSAGSRYGLQPSAPCRAVMDLHHFLWRQPYGACRPLCSGCCAGTCAAYATTPPAGNGQGLHSAPSASRHDAEQRLIASLLCKSHVVACELR
jgi:hypothetical protein